VSRTVKISLIVVIGLAAALGITAAVQSKSRNLPRVLTAKVKEEDIVSKVTANGKIQAENRVELSALVQGQIVNLAVREGDRVKKGDFLLQIDKNRAAAEERSSAAAAQGSLADRDSSRATMEQAQRDWERLKKNYDSGITPEADLQKAKATLDSARSNFQSLQNRVDQMHATLNAFRDTLSKTTVVAPLDGVVTTLPVKAGEVTVIGTMNNAGTQLMTISDMSSVLAVLMVDETDTTNVQVGQRALLTIDAYQGKTFEGLVTEVGSSPILKDDPDLVGLTTTSDAINFKVKVKLLAPPARIRPGFSVSTDIITGTKKGALSVPLAAVVVRDNPKGQKTETGRLKTEDGVYLLKDGKAAFTPIKTGITGELLVEVADGLSSGQEIITGPFKALRALKDGDRVAKATEKEKKDLEAKGTGG
jgi:HlyD family secretion protein